MAFLECHLTSKCPFAQFDHWFKEAEKLTNNYEEVNATCRATATKDGKPSARMVLLKAYGKTGFKFFTNDLSRKGIELNENPMAAMTFYWSTMSRSVRIEGTVHRLPDEEAYEYWAKRPVESQASAFVSLQSSVVPSRQLLVDAVRAVKEKYTEQGAPIPKPPHWGGYVLVPSMFEFWQGQSNRLHDRIRFRKRLPTDVDSLTTHSGEDDWVFERLAP